MTQLTLAIASEDAMVELGRTLAAALGPGMAVYLRGELGAGKTTLARGIARGLGHAGAVKSPTYTLVEPYYDLSPVLYHFDLYRLGDPEELEFMGIRDYFNDRAIALVEWPERGGEFLPTPDATLTIAVDGDSRVLSMTAHSDRGRETLNTLNPRGRA